MNPTAPSRGRVLVRLAGGLGNQMFQYAAGRAAALRSDRQLALDCSAFARRGEARRYGLGAFQIAARVASPLERFRARALAGSRAPAAIRQAVAAICRERWSIVREPAGAAAPAAFDVAGNLVLEGFWQSPAYFAGAADVIRGDFTFREPPPAEVGEWLRRIASGPSVAVHVRRGDYASAPAVHAVHGTLDAAYYAAAGHHVAGLVQHPRFFLFSDDPLWAEANVSLPGPTHVVRHAVPVADHEDLRLMAACDHFIIANSTFSWWAAWLGQASHKVVLAPRRWFAQRPLPPDLLPASWTVLG